MTAQIFFSYSHKDEDLRNELEVHLSMLKRRGLIEAWHDRRIIAGSDLSDSIDAALNKADIVLFLVSPDFLASDYCYDVEVARAMERHAAGEARVIPVILRPSEWHPAPFGKLLAAPKDGLPVTKWPNKDDAFLDVTKSIRRAVEELGKSMPAIKPTSQRPPTPEWGIRSSNLRVAKAFSQQDRDQFLQETFEYIAKFFESSLAELQARNAEIAVVFERIDARRFVSVAYRYGRRATGCTVYVGGASVGKSICYLSSESGDTNSFNESLSVNADDHALFFTALDWGSSGVGSGQKLSMEGAAELLWGIFMEPLQQAR